MLHAEMMRIGPILAYLVRPQEGATTGIIQVMRNTEEFHINALMLLGTLSPWLVTAGNARAIPFLRNSTSTSLCSYVVDPFTRTGVAQDGFLAHNL
jgi:hypothetical protein